MSGAILLMFAQESERRLRDLLAGKKPEGAADAAAVATVGKKKSVAARSSQMQMFQARELSVVRQAWFDVHCHHTDAPYSDARVPRACYATVILIH